MQLGALLSNTARLVVDRLGLVTHMMNCSVLREYVFTF